MLPRTRQGAGLRGRRSVRIPVRRCRRCDAGPARRPGWAARVAHNDVDAAEGLRRGVHPRPDCCGVRDGRPRGERHRPRGWRAGRPRHRVSPRFTAMARPFPLLAPLTRTRLPWTWRSIVGPHYWNSGHFVEGVPTSVSSGLEISKIVCAEACHSRGPRNVRPPVRERTLVPFAEMSTIVYAIKKVLKWLMA